jgi:hypothetical protein
MLSLQSVLLLLCVTTTAVHTQSLGLGQGEVKSCSTCTVTATCNDNDSSGDSSGFGADSVGSGVIDAVVYADETDTSKEILIAGVGYELYYPFRGLHKAHKYKKHSGDPGGFY